MVFFHNVQISAENLIRYYDNQKKYFYLTAIPDGKFFHISSNPFNFERHKETALKNIIQIFPLSQISSENTFLNRQKIFELIPRDEP